MVLRLSERLLMQLFERLRWTEREKRVETTVDVYEWTVEHTNGDVEQYYGHDKRIKDAFLLFDTYCGEHLESRALLEDMGVFELYEYDRLSPSVGSTTEIDSVKEVRDKTVVGVDRVVVEYDSIDREIIDSHITYTAQYPASERD